MRKFAILLVLGALVAGGGAWLLYNKPHTDYSAQSVAHSWAADELVTWYKSHPEEEHGQWQDQVVAVTGEISSADSRGVVLSPGVVVTWDANAAPDETPSGVVLVKGRVVGFDDLFGEVRLDHARLLP